MNRRLLSSFVRSIFVVAALAAFSAGMGCSRGLEPEQHPLRQKVVGHWMAGRPSTNMALLDLNDDGTFQYVYDTHSKPALKLTGLWTIDDDAIVGQIKTVENAAFKVGDTFPFGKITTATEATLMLRQKDNTDEYQRSTAPAADAARK
jgi:hypothetical protein